MVAATQWSSLWKLAKRQRRTRWKARPRFTNTKSFHGRWSGQFVKRRIHWTIQLPVLGWPGEAKETSSTNISEANSCSATVKLEWINDKHMKVRQAAFWMYTQILLINDITGVAWRQNLFLGQLESCGWFTDVRICSWRKTQALIWLRTNKKNLPFDIENKVRYLQFLLFSSLLILYLAAFEFSQPSPRVCTRLYKHGLTVPNS